MGISRKYIRCFESWCKGNSGNGSVNSELLLTEEHIEIIAEGRAGCRAYIGNCYSGKYGKCQHSEPKLETYRQKLTIVTANWNQWRKSGRSASYMEENESPDISPWNINIILAIDGKLFPHTLARSFIT